jgi:hypothetical protein
MLFAGTLHADLTIFTASGTASDGRPMNGKATINFLSASQMTITLENTAGVGQLGGISSVLDGFSFTFSTAPTTIKLTNAMTIAGTPQIYDCTAGTCVTYAGSASSPYGWGVTGSLTTPLLSAGSGSFKPYGIVNNNTISTSHGKGGIKNEQHNPYLNGPVTFTLDLTGMTAIPNITAASFYFGTEPDVVTGSHAPIPAAFWLLGTGLVGLVGIRRRSKK